MAGKRKSFWLTLPGILTGAAVVAVAIVGIFLALSQTKAPGPKANVEQPTKKVEIAYVPPNPAVQKDRGPVNLPAQMYDEMMNMRKELEETNPNPEEIEFIVSSWIIRAFAGHVVRYGEDFQRYRTPKLLREELEFVATPTDEYFDEQGRKFRTVRMESRRSGGLWTEEPDATYMWEKEDWKKL